MIFLFCLWHLHLCDGFIFEFRPLCFGFVPQHGPDAVANDKRQPQTPHQGDGVEEVCISRAGVDPEVVECWPEEACIENCRRCYEAIPVDYICSAKKLIHPQTLRRVIGLTREDMTIQREQAKV